MKIKKSVMIDIKNHVEDIFPEESVGIIVNGEYIRCKNIAEDKVKNFEVSVEEYAKYLKDKTLECVIHSHNNDNHLSSKDMIGQIKTNVPWGIANTLNGKMIGLHLWGDSLEVADLKGREFIHGSYDCYGLVRDYYRKEKGITLKQYPRDNFWWDDGENLLSEENFKKTGFETIDKSEIKCGDVVLLNIRSKVINHSAVYLGNGEILHHLSNRLSRQEPIHQWNKHIVCCLRHKGE